MIYGKSKTTAQSRPVLTDDDGNLLTKQTDASGNDVAGAKITAATIPTGGSGLLGWLSAIWYAIVGGQNGYTSRVSVTRPANTTPYTAGDVIGATAAAIEMTSIGPAGGSILVTGADLEIDVSAIPSGMTSFVAECYNVTPPSALADNAAWDLPIGDRDAYLGFIEFGVVADKGSTLYCQADQVNKQFKLASGSTSLFCYLKTTGGFTPAGNSEVYRLRLRSVGL